MPIIGNVFYMVRVNQRRDIDITLDSITLTKETMIRMVNFGIPFEYNMVGSDHMLSVKAMFRNDLRKAVGYLFEGI